MIKEDNVSIVSTLGCTTIFGDGPIDQASFFFFFACAYGCCPFKFLDHQNNNHKKPVFLTLSYDFITPPNGLEDDFPFQMGIFRLHVNLPGCTVYNRKIHFQSSNIPWNPNVDENPRVRVSLRETTEERELPQLFKLNDFHGDPRYSS